MDHRRAFTIVELLAVTAVLSMLLGMLPALSGAEARALLTKEGQELRAIHQSWVLWSDQFDGSLPRPGLVDRFPVVALGGINVPGRGPEDLRYNSHANLYSVAIMHEFISPGQCVGVTEASVRVFVKQDYNWNRYVPEFDSYWDPSFRARLETQGSNVSYATIPLCGERKTMRWTSVADSAYVLCGNRGPEGSDSLDEHLLAMKESTTSRLHGDPSEWVGQACFGDNHTEVLKALQPPGLTYADPDDPGGAPLQDNLFNNDAADDPCEGLDVFLTMVSTVVGADPPRNGEGFHILQWD